MKLRQCNKTLVIFKLLRPNTRDYACIANSYYRHNAAVLLLCQSELRAIIPIANMATMEAMWRHYNIQLCAHPHALITSP